MSVCAKTGTATRASRTIVREAIRSFKRILLRFKKSNVSVAALPPEVRPLRPSQLARTLADRGAKFSVSIKRCDTMVRWTTPRLKRKEVPQTTAPQGVKDLETYRRRI